MESAKEMLAGFVSAGTGQRTHCVRSPEDVNVLQLNLGSLVMENREVDIELPLCELYSPLLAIKGKDGGTIQKSQARVGSAEVGLGGSFA
jgi:hypothetical protein